MTTLTLKDDLDHGMSHSRCVALWDTYACQI